MKNFIRKIFFYDNPAAGAVFSIVLSLFSGFCTANLACFSQLFYCLWHGIMIFPDPLWNIAIYIPLILQMLIGTYTLFLALRFFYTQDKSRFKWIFWTILAAAGSVRFVVDNSRFAVVICIILVYYGLNALCVRKNNYGWFIAQAAGWLCCLPGVAILFDSINFLDHIDGEFSLSPIPVDWRIPLVYSAVLFYLLVIYSNFKLWASASGKQLRDLWGKKCTVLAALFVIAQIAMRLHKVSCLQGRSPTQR